MYYQQVNGTNESTEQWINGSMNNHWVNGGAGMVGEAGTDGGRMDGGGMEVDR